MGLNTMQANRISVIETEAELISRLIEVAQREEGAPFTIAWTFVLKGKPIVGLYLPLAPGQQADLWGNRARRSNLVDERLALLINLGQSFSMDSPSHIPITWFA